VSRDAPRILIVAKYASLERLQPHDVERMVESGVLDRGVLERSREVHEAAVEEVRTATAPHGARLLRVEQIREADFRGCDLVITVGGDGTVFAVNTFVRDADVIALNSDPTRSIGSFTRCLAEDFRATFEAWMGEDAQVEALPRLRAKIDSGAPDFILNDALFTHRIPAAMSRYRLQVHGDAEDQWSSGVWIATAAGATGGIASAGIRRELAEVDPHRSTLLYKVREPFVHRRRIAFLQGLQEPAEGLDLIAAEDGIGLYVDGPHILRPAPPGATVRIRPADQPLRLVRTP